jgi:hypothetical protein
MTTPSMVNTTVQWRWDRFDAKKVTSVDWARRNCVGNDLLSFGAQQAMQKQVIQEAKAAGLTIGSEIHQLLHDAAEITGMSYCCKLTGHTLPCINSKDIRLSWMQDGSAENLQRLAWMFYYYGTELYRLGRSSLSHCEWVERKIMTEMNVAYVHLERIPIGTRTCVQQLYGRNFNNVRTNIMRRGASFQHASYVKVEQPKVEGLFKKNFKRGKSTFFVTVDVDNSAAWHKVNRNLFFVCIFGMCFESHLMYQLRVLR